MLINQRAEERLINDQTAVGVGAAPMTLAQLFFNNGGKKGLNGIILGQHLSLILVTALQQAGPMPMIWPLVSDLKISRAHPSVLVIVDQHSPISVTFIPGVNKFGKATLLAEFCPVV